jgi:hypothetical protein
MMQVQGRDLAETFQLGFAARFFAASFRRPSRETEDEFASGLAA